MRSYQDEMPRRLQDPDRFSDERWRVGNVRVNEGHVDDINLAISERQPATVADGDTIEPAFGDAELLEREIEPKDSSPRSQQGSAVGGATTADVG